MIAQLAGIALSFVFKNFGIALISIALTFGVLWLAPYWQPAYTIFHKMMGNKNIPPALPKFRRKWWEYIILYIIVGIKLYILLAVLFIGIKLIFSI